MTIFARNIAEHLGTQLFGPDILISGVCSLTHPLDGMVAFVTNLDQASYEVVHKTESLFLVKEIPANPGVASYVVVKNPRHAFALATHLFEQTEFGDGVHHLAFVHPAAILRENVSIGPYSVIGPRVILAQGVVVESNTTIMARTQIGSGSRIKSNSVIGTDGFGFEYSDIGVPTRIVHLGGVFIGSNVEIGCNTVIARGTIDDTIIKDDVKIDDHVFIAHNVQIGPRSVIIAGSEISGSVRIGADCWISPQVTILNQVSIGDRALVGIGSVVISDVESETIVVGNPAKFLKRR
jgi:UDP-3-O-[3-hydroxymyristoyl] glucosamine N-acyltransferase